MAVNTVCLTGPNTVSLASANAVNLTCPTGTVEPGTPAVASIPGSGRRGPYTDELTSPARLDDLLRHEDDIIILL